MKEYNPVRDGTHTLNYDPLETLSLQKIPYKGETLLVAEKANGLGNQFVLVHGTVTETDGQYLRYEISLDPYEAVNANIGPFEVTDISERLEAKERKELEALVRNHGLRGPVNIR